MKIIKAVNDFKSDSPFESLYVNCCGYYYDIDVPTNTERPNGRGDYQIICVTSGILSVKYGEEYKKFSEGSVILFRPREMQSYSTQDCGSPAYFWIHFNGSVVERMLVECGFKDSWFMQSSFDEEDIHILRQMVTEINHKAEGYQLQVLSLFLGLMVRISACRKEVQKRGVYKKLSPALNAMENEVEHLYSLKDYADMCNMSMYHFSRCFKEYTGKSPMVYRDSVALEHAAYLLRHTYLSVSEISAASGFSDALYFSKKFKKTFGISPTQYRKKYML